jgi:hypothetical protein
MASASKFKDPLLATAYEPAMNEHRHHDALVAAIVVYLMSRDRENADDIVKLIHVTTSILLERTGAIEQACAFCFQKSPQVELTTAPVKLGGGEERILRFCNRCVDRFHVLFHGK